MNASVNGTAREVPEGTTVTDLLGALGLAATAVAVAVNQSVVRRAAFDERALCEGDAVEIIRAVAGG
ncbi:MAG: sulfur carrier protein ThiS [Vulcanimicrobiaceae bacterium]